MSAAEGVRVAAPAKINLYLRVTGRRPDGYHLLDSLAAFADVHDTLLLEPSEELSLAVEGPFAGELGGDDTGENLVMRAARRLAEAAGVPARARMTLVKRLPVASGIGGGSSDAAATLRGLACLWGLDVAASDLADLALGLGADVPACLAGRAAFMGGIGERLEPAGPLPAAGMVLLNPRVAIATPEVFGRRDGPFSPPAEGGRHGFRDVAELVRFLEPLGNDLAAPAIRVAPVVAEALDALGAASGCRLARLSGSGATCFGIFDDGAAAMRAAAEVRAARPGWWTEPATLVDDVSRIEARP